MTRDRLIQVAALAVMLISFTASGRLLPMILQTSQRESLRYTDVAIEGAPPFVALGTAIGALRGLIVDYLWIKVHLNKEKGLFYEVMADSELITKLQPRFAAVWAFHGHNMAYNISVATHTEEERWEWVKAGIRLVQNEGLRYNPNDLVLHKELAFWYAHKIEGVSDDAHLHYKRQFCEEWHNLLGRPPDDSEERVEWIRRIAEAPASLEEAEARTPGVKALVEKLREALDPLARQGSFSPDKQFLFFYGQWQSVKENSEVARLLGFDEQFRQEFPMYRVFDAVAADPRYAAQWEMLILWLRKKTLREDYNMDPQLMYEFTRDLGPIDWRHGQAHALYWSRKGSLMGERRVSADEDDVYKILNNARIELQAMQGLARSGRITFDPFSTELPSRFPDPRWIDAIDSEFRRLYSKYYRTRGGGPETFIGFFKNFMSYAIREWYRAGERERAQKLLDRLDQMFGEGYTVQHGEYKVPLDVFVKNETYDQYQAQPHLAPSEVVASLRYGFRVGIGQDRPEVYRQALEFAQQVTEYFKSNRFYEHVNKFGRGRINELVAQLDDSVEIAFTQLMIDTTISLEERANLWAQVDKLEPQLRVRVYDRIVPFLERQVTMHPLGQRYTMAQLFPEPPGLEMYRAMLARQRAEEERRLQEQRDRDAGARRSDLSTKSGGGS